MMPGMTPNVKNRHPLLQSLGERTRQLRARRGMTRKALAAAADISERQRAMLDFAMKVCLHSEQVNDADFEALHAHGFDDEDIWDIGAITAFFGLSNRVANFSGMQPNAEYNLLGRVPHKKT